MLERKKSFACNMTTRMMAMPRIIEITEDCMGVISRVRSDMKDFLTRSECLSASFYQPRPTGLNLEGPHLIGVDTGLQVIERKVTNDIARKELVSWLHIYSSTLH